MLTNLLRSIKEGRTQDKPLPPRLERQRGKYWDSRLTTAEIDKQKPV